MIGFYVIVWITSAGLSFNGVYVNKTLAYGPMQITDCYELAKYVNEINNKLISSDTTRIHNDKVHAVCKQVDNSQDYLTVLHATIPPQD